MRLAIPLLSADRSVGEECLQGCSVWTHPCRERALVGKHSKCGQMQEAKNVIAKVDWGDAEMWSQYVKLMVGLQLPHSWSNLVLGARSMRAKRT